MQTVRLVVCGDFRAAHPEKIRMSNDVMNLLSSADFCICNFEAPIYHKDCKPIKKSGPSLYQSEISPNVLKQLGFNVILMANNHIMDYGEEGLVSTLKSFDSVTTVGAGNAEDAYKVQYVESKGIKIGLLSLVHREFGVIKQKKEKDFGAAWICSPDVPEIIMEAKGKCDKVLVFPHAGVEHTATPLPELRCLYMKYIDWGADVVVASHPHCPQGWELYKGNPIYYSLGNFYFDELYYDDLWNKSIALELEITKDSKIDVKEHYVCFDDKTGDVHYDTSDRIKEHIKYVNALLDDEEKYVKYIAEKSESFWAEYKYYLLRGVGGFSLKNPIKLIPRLMGGMLLGKTNDMGIYNILQCESHRWMLENYLKNKIKNEIY